MEFSHPEEQRQVLTGFVADGLAAGERVLYFTDGPGHDRVSGWLSGAGMDVTAEVGRGALGIQSAEDSYLASGRFEPGQMIDALRSEIDASLAAGFTGFRVTGEMSWALDPVPGADRLGEYEQRVGRLFAESPAAAICQYDARRFPADRLDILSACHSDRVQLDAIVDQAGLRVVPAVDADGTRVLRVQGVVDRSTLPGWTEALAQGAGREGELRIDMRGLEFIDVAGLRALAHTAAGLGHGRRVVVRNLARPLAEVVRLVGWDAESSGLVIEQQAQVGA